MRVERLVVVLCALLAGTLAAGAEAPPAPRPVPVRTARYPSLSPDGSQIAFSWQADLWIVPATGGQARRIRHDGHDVRPKWSPDGRTLAFCSNKNGNYDLFLAPAEGGTPRQLTYHTADDILGEWSPDGKQLLFYSSRESRSLTLYTLEVDTGRLHRLTWDEVACQTPAYAPDGRWVVYTRGGTGAFRKGYRGSANADIWAVSVAEPRVPWRLTDWNGNDMFPFVGADGKTVYYVSERDGVFNLWRTDRRGARPRQVTHHRSGAVRYPSLSHDRRTVVYECDFGLWTLRLDDRRAEPQRVEITAVPDPFPARETRTVTSGVQEFEVSPDGSRIAFRVNEDLFLMPVAGGTPERLTDHPARDDDFCWHPDGRHLAFVSERNANVDLYLIDVETKELQRLTSTPAVETSPQFSPSGRWLAFIRGAGGQGIYVMPAYGGSERLEARGPFISDYSWSPDGQWLAFSRRDAASTSDIWIARVDGAPDEGVDITRSADAHFAPRFTPDGRQLLFLSTRDGGPELYAVNLTRKRDQADSERVEIDFANLHRRARRISTVPNAAKSQFAISPDGKTCYYLAGSEIWRAALDVSPSPGRVLTAAGGNLRLSPDGQRLFFSSGAIRHAPVSGGEPATLNFSLQIEVDPMALRREAFAEGWRLLRDNFYDENLHGVDWDAVYARYRPLVDECLHPDDWFLLLNEMLGELNASHLGASPAQSRESSGGTPSLGFWFDYDYAGPGLKVTSLLRDGPAWKEEPLLQPGAYVLAVDGKDVSASEGFFQLLNGVGTRTVDALVNTRPTKEGARTVKLTPVSRNQWSDLFYEHWVQECREKVETLSGGRLAYLHLRAMNPAALARFRSELRSDAYDRDGAVIDVRWNGGGRIHDELFALLTPRVHAYETPRGGLRMTQPFGAYNKPLILLINQASVSDAEIFPNGFRENGLGKLVGVPTYGGVIGTGDQILIDGQTRFRIPRTGWTTLDGRNLENTGVPPDIYVENTPADILAGRDPQLEAAVRELLKEVNSGRHHSRR